LKPFLLSAQDLHSPDLQLDQFGMPRLSGSAHEFTEADKRGTARVPELSAIFLTVRPLSRSRQAATLAGKLRVF